MLQLFYHLSGILQTHFVTKHYADSRVFVYIQFKEEPITKSISLHITTIANTVSQLYSHVRVYARTLTLCTYIHTHTHTHTHTCIHTHTNTHAHPRTQSYVFIILDVYAYVCGCAYVIVCEQY